MGERRTPEKSPAPRLVRAPGSGPDHAGRSGHRLLVLAPGRHSSFPLYWCGDVARADRRQCRAVYIPWVDFPRTSCLAPALRHQCQSALAGTAGVRELDHRRLRLDGTVHAPRQHGGVRPRAHRVQAEVRDDRSSCCSWWASRSRSGCGASTGGSRRGGGGDVRLPGQGPGGASNGTWQRGHPVLDHLPAHPAAGRHGDSDLHDVPERALLDTHAA